MAKFRYRTGTRTPASIAPMQQALKLILVAATNVKPQFKTDGGRMPLIWPPRWPTFLAQDAPSHVAREHRGLPFGLVSRARGGLISPDPDSVVIRIMEMAKVENPRVQSSLYYD